MTPPTSPPSQSSKISPIRSIVFLVLTITIGLSVRIPPLHLEKFVPEFLVIAFALVSMAMCFSSIIGSILLTLTDKTRDHAALTAHFLISAVMSFVLCFSKLIERGGVKGFTCGDFDLCLKMVIWTITCGMLSAIWIRGGVEGLKREAKAVPGNLWFFLYD